MTPKELKKRFQRHEISKPEFIEKMFEHHKSLFDYIQLIQDTDIKKIEISDKGICFTSRQDNVAILAAKPDKRIAPIEILNFDAYEQEEAHMMFSLIAPGFTIFDIGANVGWYSLSIAKKFPNAKIFAFEPLPPIFHNLRRNITLNGLDIQSFNFGFSNTQKTIEFYYDPEYCSMTSEKNLSGQNKETQTCELLPLDDFVLSQNIEHLDFIKCDVEGAELFVYQGGIQSLKRFKPIIFTEMLRKWAHKFEYHPNDIIRTLKHEGYSCYTIHGEHLKSIAEITESTIETNFVFLHKDNHRTIIQDKVLQ